MSRLRMVGDAIAATLSALTTTHRRRQTQRRRTHLLFAEAICARDTREGNKP